MRQDQPIDLIVYGDFNCPYSALASIRAIHLERLRRAKVDWRAVEHAPEIPLTSTQITGELRADLRRELDEIRGLLTVDETDRLSLPAVQSNTKLATAAFAAVPPSERTTLRARLFAAYWGEGADLADSTTLAVLGASQTDDATAERWRREWVAVTKPIVPVMILPDGYVSRGLGALARLAQFATNNHDAAAPKTPKIDPDRLGGESPCFAHLLEDH